MVKAKRKGGVQPPPFFHSKYFYWGLLALVLLAAYLQKTPCLTGSWGAPETVQYRYLCYSDIQALYGFRGLDQKKIPYVQQKPFEYPPLIGYQMYVASLFSKSHPQFLNVNAVFNTLWAVLAFWALVLLIGYRGNLLWFILAPPLLFHLHINWDISTVACLALAMLLWKEGSLVGTGALLGVGFTGKMFPVFVIPFLIFELVKRGGFYKQSIARLLGGVLIGIVGMNLPILILDIVLNHRMDAVFGVFGFHAVRTPDFGTFWYWLGESLGYNPTSWSFTKFVDLSFLIGMSGSLLYLLRKQWRSDMNVWTSAAAMTAVCLLLSKVHSLQYSLWLLPYFAIHRGFTKSRVLYLTADLLIFVFGFWWYGNFSLGEAALCKSIFKFAIYLRAVGLAFMAFRLMQGKKLELKGNDSK